MQDATSPDDVKVSGLFSYPIKGCRAIEHTSATVLASGLRHDREWMLVDARQTPAQFMSQRECPLMATIGVTTLDTGEIVLTSSDSDSLVVSAPAQSALLKVKVWNHETVAQDAGDAVARWSARKLGLPASQVRLVRFHPEMRRDCNRLYAGDTNAHTFFADGYPVLLANTASLQDLNVRIARSGSNTLPMNRFRPNIVLDGLPAWEEDHLDTITIGDVILKLVKPCVRCQVTTTDQGSGSRLSDEPLHTLGTFRNNPEFGGVTFGWNAVVLAEGVISNSDAARMEYRF